MWSNAFQNVKLPDKNSAFETHSLSLRFFPVGWRPPYGKRQRSCEFGSTFMQKKFLKASVHRSMLWRSISMYS